MTNTRCLGHAIGLQATSYLLAAVGALALSVGWGCTDPSIIPGAGESTGGNAGNSGGNGGSGGGFVPLPDAARPSDATGGKSCDRDSGKCYVIVDAGPYCGDGIVQVDRGEVCDDGNRMGGDGCSGTCQVEPNFSCPPAGGRCVSTVGCGNGTREPGESCDDGNTANGDGCSRTCSVEPGWVCPTAGNPCQRLVTCGDGRLQTGEQCDLGSANGTGVGCDAHCVLQPGWTCKGHTCQVVPVCGDGQVTAGEECDEGQKPSGTGCCENCRIAASYCSCPPGGGACTDSSRCGNGALEKNELCDDGNTKDGDGCSAKCEVETGWQCRMAGKPCNPLCGDGRILQGEQCDDGNSETGDGCSSICQIEPGASCAGTPSVCTKATCGNGKVEAGESCDDGNTKPLDGCSPTCQNEPKCGTFDAQGKATSAVGACQTACGDGIQVRGVEECDDGNVLDHDGCSKDCKVEPGNTCRSGYDNPPEKLELPIIVRDFPLEYRPNDNPPSGHPDFGNPSTPTDDSLQKGRGIVATTLGLDRKPLWNGPAQDPVPNLSQSQYTGKKEFLQWYNDDPPANKTFYRSLALLQNATDKTTYAMNSDNDQPWYDLCGFFPLDDLSQPIVDQNTGMPVTYTDSLYPGRTCHGYQGLGFGNSWASHNFRFTTELRYCFQYQGNENLKFTGDDDVWVFVNGALALDLGGIHNIAGGTVTLDPTDGTGQVVYMLPFSSPSAPAAVDFKLTKGSVYEVVVFQAERYGMGSNYMLTLANFLAGRSQCGPTCGDGKIAGTEECDNGAENNDTAYGGCTTQCKFGPFCGDGEVNGTEECDDGRNITVGHNVSGCGPGCKLPPRCGDGIVQPGEECDEGSKNKDAQCGGGCGSTCQLNPSCGDAHLDPACGEECDDGLNSGGYGFCAPSCKLGPRCGDGVVQADQGEECDEGAKNSDGAGSTCTTSCAKPGFCGDGILQAERGETCDDGKNDGSCGGCTPDCQRGPYCGDGVVQKECGETCDYGAQNQTPANATYGGCLTDCQLAPYCGDGIVQGPDEQCDLGPNNGRPGFDCSDACMLEAPVP